jgi:carboxypeptidase C (cathepsin A)
MKFRVLLLVALLIWPSMSFAQRSGQRGAAPARGGAESGTDKSTDKAKAKEDIQDKKVTTSHSAKIQGQDLKYTATAGTLVMRNDEQDPKAQIFHVAYTKENVSDLAKRPVTFIFNGGPGSASVWLHIGLVGPKRIKVPDDASPLAAPYALTDNPHSLLDLTDLVFIDPVGTGYSRPAKGENASQFYGYEEDLSSVSQFIHDWITKHGRWRSPKFIIGESYGGIRSAGLSNTLFNRYRIALNGVIMISPAINMGVLAFGPATDMAYILFVPTYATTAWYHKALSPEMQRLPVEEIFRQAKEFALGEYTVALMQGHALPEAQRGAVAEKLAKFTGLSKRYVEDSNLRISMQRYAKELLRSRGVTVGRYDGRYTGIDADSAGERAEDDPSGSKVFAPFAATINDYLRNDLKFEDDHVYEILTSVSPWRYPEGRAADGSEPLRRTMSQNPLTKLFVACGYYDLACPPVSATYSVEHMRLPPDLRKNVTYGYYESGHMIYLYEPATEKLRKDLETFIKTATQ